MPFKIKYNGDNHLSLPILVCLLYKPSGLAPRTRSVVALTLVVLLFFFMFDPYVLTAFIGPFEIDSLIFEKRSLIIRGDSARGWPIAWRMDCFAQLLDGEKAYYCFQLLLKGVLLRELLIYQ
ncbi:hypothetical protein ARMSODRAFT_633342 [Armillaria solidipes]|uniref:Glycosyl hydrolase family 95 catalytic domain-containing protein n=1 Tax=Armillaria solidipes TaxID=1076256 RepID=A0A2H3BWQ3_9AGAR|nr:hypothetical protein ARMSODRAFT_633342 [Armillaria solidipes]